MNWKMRKREREVTLKLVDAKADELTNLIREKRAEVNRRYAESGLYPLSEEDLRLGEH